MKITKAEVKWFEQEQKRHGTETAMYNTYFNIAWEILKAAGCTRLRVAGKKRKR